MLKRRLIPKLLLARTVIGSQRRAALVTTIGFEKRILVGDPVSQARIYQAQAADELVFLDIDATADNRAEAIQVIRKTAEAIFMPITIGGGVRGLEDFRDFLANGADKVAVNSAAVRNPDLLRAASDRFGSQAVVLSIDYRTAPDGKLRVHIDGGKTATDLDPIAWAREGERLGAGEIMLTSIDRDGAGGGLDIAAIRETAAAVSIPVIASGGCGLTAHFIEGFLEGHADAIAAGTYFCFKDENPMQTRSQIKNANIPIRLHT